MRGSSDVIEVPYLDCFRALGMENTPWKHPSISLEELLRHTAAFLDMLLLASGYQSTGATAIWSTENVEVALSWALFLEDAMEELVDQESRLALDEALTSLMDSTPHPPGLPRLSVGVLMEARVLLLRVLLQAMGNESCHIATVVAAVAKVDAGSPQGVNQRPDNQQSLPEQVPKVGVCDGSESMPTNRSLQLEGEVVGHKRQDSSDFQSVRKRSRDCANLWSAVERETSNRCSATIQVNSLARAVETVAELNSPVKEISQPVTIWRNEEHRGDDVARQTSSSAIMPLTNMQGVVDPWRQNGLSYLMSTTTMYKLSGALIIFNGPKVEWSQVFDTLKNRDGAKAKEDDGSLSELAELCCMYLGFKQWKNVCLRLLAPSCSGKSLTCQRLLSKLTESCLFSDEQQVEIESYFVELTSMDPNIWWTLEPVLLAAAVNASSRVLNLYTESLLSHMVQASASCRHHVSIDGRQSCTAAVSERTWLLLISRGDNRSVSNEKLENLLISAYNSTHTMKRVQAQDR